MPNEYQPDDSRNNLSLSTDYAEAWCGLNFFQLDGNISAYEEESQTQLACITISNSHHIYCPFYVVDKETKPQFR